MASSSSAQSSNDWFGAQKQYWDSWFEQQRQFLGNAAASQGPQANFQGPRTGFQSGPQAQWTELLKGWQSAVFGPSPAANNTDAFRQYFTHAGESYLGMMQQFYQGTGQAKTAEQMTKEWAENLQKLFTGAVQTGADPFSAIDPLNFMASFPGIGYTREKQEQLGKLYQQWSEYEAKSRDYTAGMSKVGLEAVQKFQDYVANPPAGAAPLSSLKEIYAKWVDICEGIYAKYAMSEEYTHLYGEVVNALMAFKKKQNEVMEELAGQFNLPTRTEVDSLAKRVQELKREINALKAGAKPAAKSTASPAAAKKGKTK